MTVGRRLSTSALVAAAAIVACGPPPAYEASSHVVLVEGQGTHVERLADGSIADTSSVAPAKALAALRSAYASLGLQVNVYDPGAMLVGVSNQGLIRRLNGEQLSRYVSCGTTMTGQRANDWWVYLTATSKVTLSGSGSQVATRLEVVSVDPTGNGERIPCGSTGALEAQLVQAVRKAAP